MSTVAERKIAELDARLTRVEECLDLNSGLAHVIKEAKSLDQPVPPPAIEGDTEIQPEVVE